MLLTAEDVNPDVSRSRADLVDTIERWPGVSTFQATVSGGVITATRPKHFFRDDSGMSETVTVPIARPRAFKRDNYSQASKVSTSG